MVGDVEPVAHVQAVAIDGQGLSFERVRQHQRDELLRGTAAARNCSSNW
jgi:hypothetical protein